MTVSIPISACRKKGSAAQVLFEENDRVSNKSSEKNMGFLPSALATFSCHNSMLLSFLSLGASCSQCSFMHNSPGHLSPVLYQSAPGTVTLLG